MSAFRHVQALLLNLGFYPLMALWTVAGILASPFCLIIWKAVTGWNIGRIVRHLINIHGYGLVIMVSPFVRFQGEGFAGIKRPCIMVVNHLSFFDSYFISTLPFHDITFAVGAWPFKMYWYTLFMRLARYLDVETDDWSEVMRTCTETFSKQGTVIFFPEGHRSRDGKLQPFYSGAFRLAQETGVSIVPLCITGTDNMLPPGHFFLHPAKVRLKALSPVNPADYPGIKGLARLRRDVRQRMAQELECRQRNS
jgi:1-acyl-sn-glycerol-3-phosphate acyltransferase